MSDDRRDFDAEAASWDDNPAGRTSRPLARPPIARMHRACRRTVNGRNFGPLRGF